MLSATPFSVHSERGVLDMVYRGASKGCEPCRKAKKKCTLERPSCARCVRLREMCTGYRDAWTLRVRDQTTSVQAKVERLQDDSGHTSIAIGKGVQDAFHARSRTKALKGCKASPIHGRAASGADFGSTPYARESASSSTHSVVAECLQMTFSIRDHPRLDAETVAINCFTRRFAFQNGQWERVIERVAQPDTNVCLAMIMKACGMALIGNTHLAPQARLRSRDMYGKALLHVNSCLASTVQRTSDETLTAVTMLSVYEVCL